MWIVYTLNFTFAENSCFIAYFRIKNILWCACVRIDRETKQFQVTQSILIQPKLILDLPHLKSLHISRANFNCIEVYCYQRSQYCVIFARSLVYNAVAVKQVQQKKNLPKKNATLDFSLGIGLRIKLQNLGLRFWLGKF